MRVLLVDDQPQWRTAFKAILKRKLKDSITIEECDSVSSACRNLEANHFDLAIIDLRLIDECTYDVQGLALVREVKEKYPQTKVILATAYPKQIEDRYQEADAFVRKVPEIELFDTRAFRKVVYDLLGLE